MGSCISKTNQSKPPKDHQPQPPTSIEPALTYKDVELSAVNDSNQIPINSLENNMHEANQQPIHTESRVNNSTLPAAVIRDVDQH